MQNLEEIVTCSTWISSAWIFLGRHREKIVLDRVELSKIDIKYDHNIDKNFV